MLKVTLEFVFNEEEVKEMFEEAQIKFSKKKVNELSADITDGGNEYHFTQEVEDDVRKILVNFISWSFEK